MSSNFQFYILKNIITFIIIILMTLIFRVTIGETIISSQEWTSTPSLNVTLETSTVLKQSSYVDNLQIFSSTIKQTSFVTSSTRTETRNLLLKWLLKFELSAEIEKPFNENLKDSKSMEFFNLSTQIINEFYDNLYPNPPVETIIHSFSATSLKESLNNGNLSVKILYLQERCSLLSCSGNGQCEESKTQICWCNLGYRGERCNELYAVNGTQRIWTNWTLCTKSCSNGTQIRTGVCHPKPLHGGVCTLGNDTVIETSVCNANRCPTKYSNEDYILVAIICGSILILIVLLLFFLCCSSSYSIPIKSQRSNEKLDLSKGKDSTDSIRLQSAFRKQLGTSLFSANSNIKLGEKKLYNFGNEIDEGLDNPIYYDELEASEEIYKKQLKRFLKEVSNISKDVSLDNKSPEQQH
ncbi:uncharacterized protein LOC101240257 isoform X2 [Hydra vulgaris]|uniref:uncharacterized protein LOC101240257 isoform X2 n=1 Tax=Hydra vulgaris TaxID=6087 RepID=UPI001F5FE092|nr:uncharacterized protein LOC101240257 isoform X2 [Hydra vulgaris]